MSQIKLVLIEALVADHQANWAIEVDHRVVGVETVEAREAWLYYSSRRSIACSTSQILPTDGDEFCIVEELLQQLVE